MPDYDPLILRDQLRAQIKHARAHDVTRSALTRLYVLIEYLESVIEDINNWDEDSFHDQDCINFCDSPDCDELHACSQCSEDPFHVDGKPHA